MSVPILGCLLLACCFSASAASGSAEAVILLTGQGAAGSSATPSVDTECEGSSVHDSGYVIYVLVPRTCVVGDQSELALKLPLAENAFEQFEISGLKFEHEYQLHLQSGTTRTLSVHRRGTWRGFPNLHSWRWRDGAGLLTKDGHLYLLGGWTGGAGGENEVWRSNNARDWTLINASAPWAGRHGAAWLVHGSQLIVASGDFIDDVWESSDGIRWRQLSRDAQFGRRYTPMGVSAGPLMLLMGGQVDPNEPAYGGGHFRYAERDYCPGKEKCAVAGLNDVWASRDGINWFEVSSRAPWRGRSLVQGGLFFKGRIYVVGGGLKAAIHNEAAETYIEFSDVWSSADGREWRLETTDMGFTPRTHTTVVTSPNACYVVGGSVTLQTNVSNEVFFSTDCVHFQPIPDPSPMQRRHAAGVAWFNGSLVVMGGPPYGGEDSADPPAGTTVWQYFPDE